MRVRLRCVTNTQMQRLAKCRTGFRVLTHCHIFGCQVAVWGGPLRIQVGASHMHTGKSLAARVFTRPWHILQWMQDPEQWISMISTPQTYAQQQQPFEPNPILFPSTWVPLRFLQMLAVAKVRAMWNQSCASLVQYLKSLLESSAARRRPPHQDTGNHHVIRCERSCGAS